MLAKRAYSVPFGGEMVINVSQSVSQSVRMYVSSTFYHFDCFITLAL